MDSVMRLGCCHLDILIYQGWVSPQNTKIKGLINAQVQVGMPRYLPLAGGFTLSVATLCIRCSHLVEGPRNVFEGTLGDFDGL